MTKFKKSSWHYQLVKSAGLENSVNSFSGHNSKVTICSYLMYVLFSFLKLVVIYSVIGFTILSLFDCALALYFMDGWNYNPIHFYGQFLLGIILIVIGAGILWTCVLMFIHTFVFLHNVVENKENTLIQEAISSVKEKYCKFVDFE